MERVRSQSDCPDEDRLLAFSEGRLKGADLAALVEHLDGCDSCNACLAAANHASAPMPSVRTAFAPGDVVAGRYRIESFIARGGMGEVYRAQDRLLGVEVALKTVLLTAADDPRAVELLRREVKLARAISHAGVCRVFDLGEHVLDAGTARASKLLFLTMEYLPGVTLGERVRTRGALGAEALVRVASQLAVALSAAHEAGIVHRDLKSDNVMCLGDPGDPLARVVVMDFGLARVGGAGSSRSTAGLVVGSAAYMAPEQVEGAEVDVAADIYAFGVILFEAATGRLPFTGATPMATALARLRETPPRPRDLVPQLPASLEALILRCLARRPRDRFASFLEVSAALGHRSGGPVETVMLVPPIERRGSASRVIILGLALVAAVAVLYQRVREHGVATRAAVIEQAPAPARVPAAEVAVPATTAPAVTATVEVPAPLPPAAVKAKARPRARPEVDEAPAPKRLRSQSDLDGFPDPYK